MGSHPRKDFDFVDDLTAQLRCGRRAWRVIKPCVSIYRLADAELFDWTEIVAFIRRSARMEPPEAA